MDATQRAKITAFLNDKAMSNAVFSALMDTYTRPIPHNDANVLAGARIAITFLREAWMTLETHRTQEHPERPTNNPGL